MGKVFQPNLTRPILRSGCIWNALMDCWIHWDKKIIPVGNGSQDRNGYDKGYTLYGFDLTPGATGLGPLTLVKQGNLSVAVTFAKPLPKTVMMICMMVYDSILEINQHRQLIADFTA